MASPIPAHALEPVRPLTPSQEAVLDLLVKGRSYVSIARQLGLSIRTVHDRVDEIAQILPYPPEPGVHRKEHVMLWGVHRVWHKYVQDRSR